VVRSRFGTPVVELLRTTSDEYWYTQRGERSPPNTVLSQDSLPYSAQLGQILDGCSGSKAEVHHTPKLAVRAAGIVGKAEVRGASIGRDLSPTLKR
jgi:hypothetical protein